MSKSARKCEYDSNKPSSGPSDILECAEDKKETKTARSRKLELCSLLTPIVFSVHSWNFIVDKCEEEQKKKIERTRKCERA